MKEAILKMAPLLKRIFHTNGLTTFGGIVCLVGVYMLFKHIVDKDTALEVMGAGTGIIGFGAKDGVRDAPTVAPESLSAPDVAGGPPASTVAAVLLAALLGLSACVGSHGAPTGPVAPLALLASAPADTLPPGASVPPYLATPPAGLTKRQLRQFRRAQRRALVEASRQVPRSLGKGAAYNAAPGGTATATYKPSAPVANGDSATATDNRKAGQNANGGVSLAGHDAGPATGATALPHQNLVERVLQTIGSSIPWVAGGLVAAVVGWLLLVPVGGGGLALPLVAAVFRRRGAS